MIRAADNPFATDRQERITYRVPEPGWEGLLGRLAELGCRAAVVGAAGSGKTRFLEELAARLVDKRTQIAWLRVERRQARPTDDQVRDLESLRDDSIALIDGGEQLSATGWRRLREAAHRAGGVVVASQRPGLLPTLLACRSTPELLDELVHELCGLRCEELGHPAPKLIARHGGNIRDALLELYDLWAIEALPEPILP